MKAMIHTFTALTVAAGLLVGGNALTASTAQAGPHGTLHDTLKDVDLSGTGFIRGR